MEEIKISCPVWDTHYNKLIYPVSPGDREVINAWYPNINHLLSNSKLEDKEGRYKCTQCNENVFPKRGGKNRWHFSHYPGSSCAEDGMIKIGGESDIHKLAKYILHDLLSQKRPITILGATFSTSHCNNTKISTNIEYCDDDSIKTEYTIPGSNFRADVAVVNNSAVRYIFEYIELVRQNNDEVNGMR